MKRFKQHLRNNGGDANISRMTLIAIAFVVGAILLVLVTSAFRNPINRWFDKVTNGWFAKENGEFAYTFGDLSDANDSIAQYEYNANGTIKNVVYISEFYPGEYYLLKTDASKLRPGYNDPVIMYKCDANGNLLEEIPSQVHTILYKVQISEDGQTITSDDGETTWYATPKP